MKKKLETIAVEFYVVLIFSEGNVLVHSINTHELKYKSNIYFNKSNIIEMYQEWKPIISVPPSFYFGAAVKGVE